MFIHVFMLMGCQLVWLFVKFEWKMRKYEFWWKMNIMMILMWIDDMISCLLLCLIAFWYTLTNEQVWGTNLGQRGSKTWFWGEKWWIPNRETHNLGTHYLCSSPNELVLAVASYTMTTLMILVLLGSSGSIRTSETDSFDVFYCCHAF